MKNIVLDFTGCKYIDEIYEIIKKEFKFPDFFGKNPDALWDCLKEYAHPPLHVCIFGYDTLSREFQVYMEDIFKIFNYLNDCSPDITFEIISKTLSFSSFKKDQRNSLGKKYISFKFCKTENSISHLISDIFHLPQICEDCNFTPLEERLKEYSDCGLHIILTYTKSLPEHLLPYLNNFIDFLKVMNQEYPKITWEIMS